VDKQAIESAERIVAANKERIGDSITFRVQNEPTDIFLGVVRPGDRFECSFCNPPFHATVDEARASSNRKWMGLNRKNEITKKVNHIDHTECKLFACEIKDYHEYYYYCYQNSHQ
jgi:23S rRNA A1618 N6-methylase RlmF